MRHNVKKDKNHEMILSGIYCPLHILVFAYVIFNSLISLVERITAIPFYRYKTTKTKTKAGIKKKVQLIR